MDAINVMHTIPVRHLGRSGDERVSFDVGSTLIEPRRADLGSMDWAGPPAEGVKSHAGELWKRLTLRLDLPGSDPGPPLPEKHCIAFLEGPGRHKVNTPLSMALLRTPVIARGDAADQGMPLGRKVPRSRRIESGEPWIQDALRRFMAGNLLFHEGEVYVRSLGEGSTVTLRQAQGGFVLDRHRCKDLRDFGGLLSDASFLVAGDRADEHEALSATLARLVRITSSPAHADASPTGASRGNEDLVLMANAVAIRARRWLDAAQGLEPRVEGVAGILRELAPYELRGYVGAVDEGMAEDVFRLSVRAADIADEYRACTIRMAALRDYAKTVALPRLTALPEMEPGGDDEMALLALGGTTP